MYSKCPTKLSWCRSHQGNAWLPKQMGGPCRQKTFLSQSTAEGLRVTFTRTLEHLDYLQKSVRYTYLLTSWLNQDKAKNLFGIVGMSPGCNTQPKPQQFLLTVNCLSFYKLARSVTGGNAVGHAMSSLLGIENDGVKAKQKLVDTVNLYMNKQAPSTWSTWGNDAQYQSHARRSDSRVISQIAG